MAAEITLQNGNMDIPVTMLPTEERDRALGRYMDAWSRLETIMDHVIEGLLRTDWQAAKVLASILYSQQRIKLLEALAAVRLPPQNAERVARICEQISRRNTRRNHIVHGSWQQAMTVYDDHYESEWVRVYTPSDPALAAIRSYDDSKLLGWYNFTLPALDRAAAEVEVVTSSLSSLMQQIRSEAGA